MPLTQTMYGEQCPLGFFKIDVPAGAGCYDADPIEACLSCKFSDSNVKEFNLEEICKCPVEMTSSEYIRLQQEYMKTGNSSTLSKEGFWKFVAEYKTN